MSNHAPQQQSDRLPSALRTESEHLAESGHRAESERPRRVLIVTAHPEPRSLTAALADFAVERLRSAGHEVRVSDLYAMKWQAAIGTDDFPDHPADTRLNVLEAQGAATGAGRLAAELAAEQEKLRWADAVVFQFPLWWFSVPAILKGWIDRVLTYGFAHGPGVELPYGDGALGGRRGLLAVSVGARESSFSDRGVHGPLADVLFPLQHGVLWFTGLAPLEPFAAYGTVALPEEGFAAVAEAYGRRLDGLFTEEPVPFRRLDGGDYERDMRLKEGLGRPGGRGLELHTR
ncbi:NAD(P)H-dependent oxidoreductase [Kitasatospora sp. NPDC056327]|uniref:NAD(P)H-dependent oxidoreductase n=1 Tax=Kitasatospora sp. NPDC056327 TaxID=3345785 RepID=UPI0035D7E596